MRPVYLIIEGMTAFRDRQTVDMRDLGLFCVTGATGAGKTTIFDAFTFALYGKVHRVANRVRALIATDRPEARVVLDFAISGTRHRVTRRITRGTGRGAGRHDALLERREGSAWVGVQSGAEQVSAAIEELTGLDFHAFTRAAMLPQGEFARFLTGDATERRGILVRLLDLSRVERAGPRARRRADALRGQERVLRDTVAREGSATADGAIAAAEAAVAVSEIRAERCRDAAETARRSMERALAASRTAEMLTRSVARFDGFRARHATLDEDRRSLDARRMAAGPALAAAEEALCAAVAGRDAADETKQNLVREVGTIPELAALGEAARTRQAALSEAARAADEIASARRALDGLRDAFAVRATALTAATKAATAAQATLEKETATRLAAAQAHHTAAVERLHAVEREHASAALRAHVRDGDPCPVCERAVDTELPAVPTDIGDRLEQARGALAASDATLSSAGAVSAETLQTAQAALAALDAARADRSAAESAMKVAEVRVEGLLRAQSVASARASEAEERLGQTLGSPLPTNLEAHLTERRNRMETAEAGLGQATLDVAAAHAAAQLARDDCSRAEADGARGQAALSALDGELRTAAADLDHVLGDAGLPATGRGPRDETLPAALERLSSVARIHAAEVARAAKEQTASMHELLLAIGVTPQAGQGAADALEAAARGAAADHARCVAQLGALTLQRDRLRDRQARADALGKEAASLEALAIHLKSDRFVEFLLSEYVEEIAGVASARLREISAGRYSLEVENDGSGAFHVVDHHNADERRGVVTLSGGETFQASLALALALSEGLANLSGDTRLDAVFIDEGFASLDAESLDLAIDALENVHAGGRMVGVITHVPQMAERILDGIEVIKGEGGSEIRRRAA